MEVSRDRAISELEELAAAAEEQKEARWSNFGRYSRLRTVFWISAGLLAGAAGILALGDASRTLTAAVAFSAAFSTALEGKIAPADRRRRHQQAAAEYDDIAWWARHQAHSQLPAADLESELRRLQQAKHRLDLEFGPNRRTGDVQSPSSS
jgi:hypothetical protein